MLFSSTELVCPAGKPGEAPIIIDLLSILVAEARQSEVAMVTSQKAPELLAEFNRAWLALNTQVVTLRAEKLVAERALETRHAIMLIEVIPGVLKDKGLASNDANREALLVLDPEHRQLRDTVDQITAVVEFLGGKQRAADNAFSAVKKILGDTSASYRGANHNLSGDTGERSVSHSPPPVTRPTGASGFGKPKYGP